MPQRRHSLSLNSVSIPMSRLRRDQHQVNKKSEAISASGWSKYQAMMISTNACSSVGLISGAPSHPEHISMRAEESFTGSKEHVKSFIRAVELSSSYCCKNKTI